MSRKIVLWAVMMLASMAGGASTASASSWTSNGATLAPQFSMSAPASKLTVGSSNIVCTSPTLSGGLYGPTGPLTVSVAGANFAFSGCRAGGIASTADCGITPRFSLFVDSGYTVVTGHLARLISSICTFTVPSISGCTVTLTSTFGSTFAWMAYNDGTGVLTISSSGQALTATWTSCGTLFGAASGSSAATFGSNSTPPGDLNFRVTSSFVPIIHVV